VGNGNVVKSLDSPASTILSDRSERNYFCGLFRVPLVADRAPATCDEHQLPAAPVIIRGQAASEGQFLHPFIESMHAASLAYRYQSVSDLVINQ
jgi:hypothetical protein